jgi:hypothetical protein
MSLSRDGTQEEEDCSGEKGLRGVVCRFEREEVLIFKNGGSGIASHSLDRNLLVVLLVRRAGPLDTD